MSTKREKRYWTNFNFKICLSRDSGWVNVNIGVPIEVIKPSEVSSDNTHVTCPYVIFSFLHIFFRLIFEIFANWVFTTVRGISWTFKSILFLKFQLTTAAEKLGSGGIAFYGFSWTGIMLLKEALSNFDFSPLFPRNEKRHSVLVLTYLDSLVANAFLRTS